MFIESTDFSFDVGQIWLNCAHQGPLPSCAARAAQEAVDWKQRPNLLTSERFREVPERLRQTVARLIGGKRDDIVLANSASYGLHLIANGLRWRSGDEVLVMDSDFPSDLLPWLRLASRGVSVRRARPAGMVFEADEIRALIGPKTRVQLLVTRLLDGLDRRRYTVLSPWSDLGARPSFSSNMSTHRELIRLTQRSADRTFMSRSAWAAFDSPRISRTLLPRSTSH